MRKLDAKKLILASHNKGKLAEFKKLFASHDIEVVLAGDLNLPEPEETGETFEENAILKAEAAAQATGEVALADDSGLCVYGLDGAPGVYSARYAINPQSGERDFAYGMKRVHDALGDKPDRRAAFVAVLALVWPDGHAETFEGRCEGGLIWPPRGDKGFGYDPFFVPEGEAQSFGEAPALKEKHAHRHKAFAALASNVF